MATDSPPDSPSVKEQPELKNSNNSQVFEIGLCMAGAVSAGAYTAGVVDFLIEALEEWERRKALDKTNSVPRHQVQISVMGGASAGGMTSIITSTILNNKQIHLKEPQSNILAEHPENKLYHSWVDLTDPDMFARMLDTSDIQNGKIISALNSDFIDLIAKRVVEVDTVNWESLPNFIKPGIKVFTTLTNLQGFDYVYDFIASERLHVFPPMPGNIPLQNYTSPVQAPTTSKYHSVIHNDYACFELTESSISGSNLGWMPLNLRAGINTKTATDAAMATGAFPIGLKPRFLSRDPLYVNANPWLKEYLVPNPLNQNPYTTLNVDGGLINNEPFEKVRDVLNNFDPKESETIYENYNTFRNTVIMVEPFPTQESVPIKMDLGLFNVAGLTLSSMLNQMRSKPDNITNAMDESKAGQFLITPSRLIPGPNGPIQITGERAIACGALDGFSGFLNKEFRVHDYFLGRFNCKIFLKDYFTVPETALENNPIFKKGYDIEGKNQFQSRKSESDYQIIPIFLGEEDLKFPEIPFKNGQSWPVWDEKEVNAYTKPIRKRVRAFLLNTVSLNWFNKFLILAGAYLVLDRTITDGILGKIKSDLNSWNLLKKT